MSKQDRQKLGILIVLLAVLGLTIVLGYRMNQPQTTAAVQTPEAKTSANPPAASEAHIRLDLLENPEAAGDIGKRNLFQYWQAPPPAAPPPPRGSSPGNNTQQPMTSVPPQTARPAAPAPPPITLKYQGFAATSTPNLLVAFLADDARHYNVTVGEVLMGRFRIVSINEKSVDIEDLEHNRRQTLPLLK
jgi:hypothetical protein